MKSDAKIDAKIKGDVNMKQQISHLLTEQSESDLSQIAQLEKQLFSVGSWTDDVLQDFFSQRHTHFFVIRLGNEIIGYCMTQVMFDTAEILRIGVGRAHQGQGVAKQILMDVMTFLRNIKVDKLLLEVRNDNLSAIGLYQGFDFKQIHVRKNYYDNKDGTFTDALILQKVLD